MTNQRPPRPIPWTCDICDQPIADGAGYLHIEYREAFTVDKAWQQYEDNQRRRREEAGHPVPEDLHALFALPKAARWQAHHKECDPDPDGDYYWIDVARLRTISEILDWNRHPHGKDWTTHTDWDNTIARRVGAAVDRKC